MARTAITIAVGIGGINAAYILINSRGRRATGHNKFDAAHAQVSARQEWNF
jgi:hypothetical protein